MVEARRWGSGDEGGLAKGFVDRLPELAAHLTGFVKQMRFWTAPIDSERRVRERIEAAISRRLRSEPPPVGPFQDEGIRYRRRRPDEPVMHVCVHADCILGLPEVIEV